MPIPLPPMYLPMPPGMNMAPRTALINGMDQQAPFPFESSETDPSLPTNGIIYQYYYHYPSASPSVFSMIKDKEFSLPKWDLKEMME